MEQNNDSLSVPAIPPKSGMKIGSISQAFIGLAVLFLIVAGFEWLKYSLVGFPDGADTVISSAVANLLLIFILIDIIFIILIVHLRKKKTFHNKAMTFSFILLLIVAAVTFVIASSLGHQNYLVQNDTDSSPSSLNPPSLGSLVDPLNGFLDIPVSRLTCILSSDKQECYRYLAVQESNISFCKDSNDECYEAFAVALKNVSLCPSEQCTENAQGFLNDESGLLDSFVWGGSNLSINPHGLDVTFSLSLLSLGTTPRQPTISQFIWDFGDGSLGATSSPSGPVQDNFLPTSPVNHVYPKAGSYLLKITAVDVNGLKYENDKEDITVSGPAAQ